MADKINGGGFFSGVSDFIDSAKDIASDGIDTINETVEGYTEDAKQGIDDAAERLHDVVDGMEESVDTLKSMGAGAKRKLDGAMDTVGEATRFASDVLSSPLELGIDPRVASDVIQDFFSTPFEEHVTESFRTLGGDPKALEEAVGFAMEVADETVSILEGHDLESLGAEIGEALSYTIEKSGIGEIADYGISIDGARDVARQALDKLVDVAEVVDSYSETFDDIGALGKDIQNFEESYATAFAAMNPMVGIPMNVGLGVVHTMLRAVGDTDDFARAAIENQDTLEGLIMAGDPKYMLEQMKGFEKGQEIAFAVEAEFGVAAGAGGSVATKNQVSVACSNDDPKTFAITIEGELAAAAELGIKEGTEGADLGLGVGKGGKLTLEVPLENAEAVLTALMSKDVVNAASVAKAFEAVDFKGVALTFDAGEKVSIGGEFELGGVALKAGGELEIRNSVVANENGGMYGKSISVGQSVEGGVGEALPGFRVVQGMQSDEINETLGAFCGLRGLPEFDAAVDQVLSTVGDEIMLTGKINPKITLSVMAPNGDNTVDKDVVKLNVEQTLQLNEGSVKLAGQVEIKGLGSALMDEGATQALMQDLADGRVDVEGLLSTLKELGHDPKEFVTVKFESEFQKEDVASFNAKVAKVSMTRKEPPVTIASYTLVGDSSKDVALSDTIDKVKKSYEQAVQERKNGRTKPQTGASLLMSRGFIRS